MAALLAPFGIRSFRFQWPSNLAASWGFEMEVLILSWYILVETGSVMLLTAFGSLQWIGTLVAPMFGVLGDRIGHRTVLWLARTFYVLQSAILMLLAFGGALEPMYVFLVSGAMSMVRPSENVMRFALIADVMPPRLLMGAMGVERTTADSARVFGALTGAGMIAAFGIGPAYLVIVAVYGASLALTLAVGPTPRERPTLAPVAAKPGSAWHELVDAFRYVRRSPVLLAAMYLAFLVNLSAYPLTLGLLPYVAKEIHSAGQTGLGYLAASFSFGGLVGSLIVSQRGHAIRSGRWMLVFAAAWYVALLWFAFAPSLGWAIVSLLFVGCAQSFSLVPMSTVLLRHAEEGYRGRVIGIRMFAIYGLPLGLLAAGPLIAHFGFGAMASLYCIGGVLFTTLIGLRWRREVWAAQAPVNR